MSKSLSFDLLSKISKEYGNAFYILDSDVFKANYEALTSAFKTYYDRFNIAYSYKTNYTPKLVKIVDNLGGYAEVVSDMEMNIALNSGVAPSKIIWNGPVKNTHRVNELLLKGGTVNIDSAFEIDNIRSIAEKNPDKVLNVGIRCNYDVGDGVVSRFGIDVNSEEFRDVLRFIKSTPNVRLINLQAHFAKRSPEYWCARTKGMLDTYDKVVSRYGLYPERLDIGGGIYGNMPECLRKQLGIGNVCYGDYAERSAKLFCEHFEGKENRPYLFIEPGSALAGDSMRFVCRVETLKTVRGKTFATVTGSQKNISMQGINPPIEVFSCCNEKTEHGEVDIVGYTCIEGDVLYKNYSGVLNIGDFIVIGNCGSYSLVMKPPFIMPNFPVLDISNQNIEVIKRAENFSNLFSTFNF